MRLQVRALSTLLLLASGCFGQYIYTVAGTWTVNGSTGDGGAAIRANIQAQTVAVDSSGNLYMAEPNGNRVRKVTPGGKISTIAGIGSWGYSGDGGAATSTALNYPMGLAVDSSGNLYIADSGNHRVRKVAATGVISTVAGMGTFGFSGDGGAATSATLTSPNDVAVDSSGNLYIADTGNSRVRKVTAAGIISTVAGGGVSGNYYGCAGDGGAATGAQLKGPRGLAVDSSGDLFLSDGSCHTVRKVTSSGTISNFAGSASVSGFSGDGGAATSALIYAPQGIAVDNSGNVYISDAGNGRVRKVTASGIVSTVAGTVVSLGNDGIAATSVVVWPNGVAVDASGNLYIAEAVRGTIRAVALGTSNPLPDLVAKTSVFRAGLWVKDYNANGVWDGTSTDRAVYLGQSGDVPVVGDWNGDGRAKIGIFRNGMWVLDYNGNGVWDGPGTDRLIYLGQTGDTPVVGDWNGSGTAKVGIFRNGLWVLDYNGNGQWDGTATDKAIYLGQTGDTPVVGDWNAGGTAKVGVFRSGLWVLDYNGNGQWDGIGTDKAFYLGQAGDTPVIGDWNNTGSTKAGIFRSGLWVLDYDGSGTWDGTSADKAIYLGQAGDTPVVGDWIGNGKTKVGIFRSGLWVLDYDGSGAWDGPGTDKAIYLGQTGDQAVIGTW